MTCHQHKNDICLSIVVANGVDADKVDMVQYESWVWYRFLYVFIVSTIFSFSWGSLSTEAQNNNHMLTTFITIILLIYAGLKPAPGENKTEIQSAGEFLLPIILFAGPILGSISFFLAAALRNFFI